MNCSAQFKNVTAIRNLCAAVKQKHCMHEQATWKVQDDIAIKLSHLQSSQHITIGVSQRKGCLLHHQPKPAKLSSLGATQQPCKACQRHQTRQHRSSQQSNMQVGRSLSHWQLALLRALVLPLHYADPVQQRHHQGPGRITVGMDTPFHAQQARDAQR